MFKKKQQSTGETTARPKKKKRWPWVIAGLALIVVIALALPQVMGSGPDAPIVKGIATKEGPIVYKISTRGDVQSKHVYDVVPKVTGRVAEVHIKEGDVVAKDQPLVTLEVSDLEEQLQDLKLELKIAKATLAQIEVPSTEGQQASKEALEAALENANREYDSAKALFAEGAYSESQLKQAELAVKNAKQALANQSTTNGAKKAASERELQNLRIEGIAVKIERLESRIANAVILAPEAGSVSKVHIKTLDLVSGQGPVVTLVDTKALQISININQYDITKVALGQVVNVTADGLKDQTFTGKISAIAAVAQKSAVGQSQETVVPVLVDLENPDGAFKPNYTAKVEIVVAKKDKALLIPYEATRLDKERGRIAYVIENGKLSERVVKTGIESELYLEVIEGLKLGEYLVENPDETHKNGMSVTFTPEPEEVKP